MAEMSPWLADQVEAARADRAAALEAVGITGATTDEGGRDPINAAVDATIDTWMAKGAKSCPHLASTAPRSSRSAIGGSCAASAWTSTRRASPALMPTAAVTSAVTRS